MKIKMKSLFKVLMIALLGFAFTGIGHATTDPAENSNKVQLSDDLAFDVDLNVPLQVLEFTVSTDTDQNSLKQIEVQIQMIILPDLEKIDFDNPDTMITEVMLAADYRRARDGLNC